MAQDYDKIFKENFEELIIPLAEKLLDIDPSLLEEVPDELQYTIERKPDFLKKVKGIKGAKDYILQIEVQSTDPKAMLKRMFLYYGLLYQTYELDVHQYVLYIGGKHDDDIGMSQKLELKNLDFKYELISIRTIDHEVFIHSDRPEEVILAILCDFKNKTPDNILDTILMRLKAINQNNDLLLGKYLRQLEVISKLRNLQELTIKKIERMPLIYDIETDIRYLQGEEKGIQKGMEKGMQEGEVNKTIAIIKTAISANILTFEQIALITSTSIDFVIKIYNEMIEKDKVEEVEKPQP